MTKSKELLIERAFQLYVVASLISMAVMSIGAAALFMVLLICWGSPLQWKKRLSAELKNADSLRYLRASCYLALACALSLAGAWLFPLQIGSGYSEVHFFRDLAKVWYFFWPLLLCAGLRELGSDARRRVLLTWTGAFLALSVIGMIQYFTGFPVRSDVPEIARRIDGIAEARYHVTLFLGHHLSVASILIFPFFVALDWLRDRKRPGWMPFAVLFGAAALFFTYSRTLWVALPIGILVWAARNLSRRNLVAVTIFIVLAGAATVQLPAVNHRLHAFMGVGDRETLWSVNWELFKARPLFGVGWRHNQELSGLYLLNQNPGTHPFSGHAHNNFLDFLSGTGIVGVLAWLYWCFLVLKITLVKPAQKPVSQETLAGALFCAWVVFHLNGMTQANFIEAKVMHQMAWVIALSLLWASGRRSPHGGR